MFLRLPPGGTALAKSTTPTRAEPPTHRGAGGCLGPGGADSEPAKRGPPAPGRPPDRAPPIAQRSPPRHSIWRQATTPPGSRERKGGAEGPPIGQGGQPHRPPQPGRTAGRRRSRGRRPPQGETRTGGGPTGGPGRPGRPRADHGTQPPPDEGRAPLNPRIVPGGLPPPRIWEGGALRLPPPWLLSLPPGVPVRGVVVRQVLHHRLLHVLLSGVPAV